MFVVFVLRLCITYSWWRGLCRKPQLNTLYPPCWHSISVFIPYCTRHTTFLLQLLCSTYKSSVKKTAEPCVLNFPTVCSHLQHLCLFSSNLSLSHTDTPLSTSCWLAHLVLMKAFHLGAFEVMVVTDNRLSESGGLFLCWGFPEEDTTQSSHWWSLLYGLKATKGNGVWQRQRREVASLTQPY